MKAEIKAVEMTRRIRDMNYQRTRGMTREQRLAFYKEHARRMHAEAKMLLETTPAAPPTESPRD